MNSIGLGGTRTPTTLRLRRQLQGEETRDRADGSQGVRSNTATHSSTSCHDTTQPLRHLLPLTPLHRHRTDTSLDTFSCASDIFVYDLRAVAGANRPSVDPDRAVRRESPWRAAALFAIQLHPLPMSTPSHPSVGLLGVPTAAFACVMTTINTW